MLDGINLTQLRQLASNCLATSNSASSPGMASLFASMVYAKTRSPPDAFLYATCLLQQESHDTTSSSSSSHMATSAAAASPKRAVRLLEQAGLLTFAPTTTTTITTITATHKSVTIPTIPKTLRLEAVLLASQALARMEDWNAVLQLLEDAHLYACLSHASDNDDDDDNNNNDNNNKNNHENRLLSLRPVPTLEDDDDVAWQALAQGLSTATSTSTSIGTTLFSTTIHPLARLCCTRARAYQETGHPGRAATFYKRALRIDPQCVQALEGLLGDPLVPAQEALDLIWNLLPQQPSEWWHCWYLARVHVAAPTYNTQTRNAAALLDTTNLSTTNTNNNINNNKTMSDDPYWQDSSSLQLLTPIVAKQVDDHDHDDHNDEDEDAMMGAGPNGHPRIGVPKEASLLFGNHSHHDIQHADEETKKRDTQVQGALDKLLHTYHLEESSSVLAMAAQRAYRQSDWKGALHYCQQLARVDPLCTTAAHVHVATLVALGHKRTLFRLAHEWVEAAPKSSQAWFAVGSYYFACQRYHVAQRHYCRATRLDPQVVEAWIAFGTSFAACDESDQALASFRAAQRLAPGDPTSLLYIGMEYLRTNHTSLAEHFLWAAHQASRGTHRLCMNELGVWQLGEKNWHEAAKWFVRTLSSKTVDSLDAAGRILASPTLLQEVLDRVQDSYWEPTVFNLAHALRKLRQWDLAVPCLERCLTLMPTNPSAWTALGFCHQLAGHMDAAIDTYHQALAQKPEDPFASEMLQRALQDAVEQTTELFDQIGLQQHHQHQQQEVVSKTPKDAGRNGSGSARRQVPHGSHVIDLEEPRTSLGTRGMQTDSSYMTDDGLSLSVESFTTAGDVDMG